LRLERLGAPLACGALATQCADEWTQLQRSLSVLSGPPLDPDPTAPPSRPAAGGCSLGRRGSSIPCGWLAGAAAVLLARTRFVSRTRQRRLEEKI
jgi:hypothetical protein